MAVSSQGATWLLWYASVFYAIGTLLVAARIYLRLIKKAGPFKVDDVCTVTCYILQRLADCCLGCTPTRLACGHLGNRALSVCHSPRWARSTLNRPDTGRICPPYQAHCPVCTRHPRLWQPGQDICAALLPTLHPAWLLSWMEAERLRGHCIRRRIYSGVVGRCMFDLPTAWVQPCRPFRR